MKRPEPFDVFECELDGVNLIEASAGTGKTWNVCALYLRLLLERGLQVQQILVVTFTNAATAELRERVRGRIVETLAWLRDDADTRDGGDARGATRGTHRAEHVTADPYRDPFVPKLIASIERRTGLSRADLVLRLHEALQFFDEAAIFTIHGFCQRALADAAFAAGMPFALELAPDTREMTLEAVRDFWRRSVASGGCSPELVGHLLRNEDTPERFAELLQRSLAKPLSTRLWPAALDAATPIGPGSTTLRRTFDEARAHWSAHRDEIVSCVLDALPALHGGSYKPASVEQSARDWDAWLAETDPCAKPKKSTGTEKEAKLELLSQDKLAKCTKKGNVTPTHAFFDRASALLDAHAAHENDLEVARLALIRELVTTVGPELRRRKRERRVTGFDDMLYNLHAALDGEGGDALVRSLRERFPVALIDEFQDTDPLQFAIFGRLYGRDTETAFLVGDPKQAIYSFRNADLHAYLRARRDVERAYTLVENQRSSDGLIEALNGLFSINPRAFFLDGLDYHAVKMGEKPRKRFIDESPWPGWATALAPEPSRAPAPAPPPAPATAPATARVPSPALAPAARTPPAAAPRPVRPDLVVWTLPTLPDGTPLPKQSARAQVIQATAAEIARLVAEGARGRITLDARGLRSGDIAVLVRKHSQGTELKQALAALDIGSVELSQQSVFRSADAEEVERILVAIQQPSRETLLRAALATETLGLDAERIVAISASDTELIGHVERFTGYREAWIEHGVGPMLRRLMTEFEVSARLLRRDDGERRLTNLLHLVELIHDAASTHRAPDALLRWLHGQRTAPSTDDAVQLRLESDRNLVQIVTIHKAKGLEFPVVLCPFLWDDRVGGGGRKPDGVEYHDDDGNAVVDFRTKDEIGDAAAASRDERIRLESCAETLRLAYVALTRAVHRCYLVAGTYAVGTSHKESTRSVLNWLVAGRGTLPAAWAKNELSPAQIDAAWHAFAHAHSPYVRLAPLPLDTGTRVALPSTAPDSLSARTPPRSIPAGWRFGSFSSLIGEPRREGVDTDHDALVAPAAGAPRISAPAPGIAPDDILRFPAGPSAGECLHAILERADFTDASTWSAAIARALALHPQSLPGARRHEYPTLLGAMATRMLDDVTRTLLPDGIVLAKLPGTRRLAELAFSLPAPRVSAAALNAELRRLGYAVPKLAFGELQGYLKGVIDLVFEHEGRWYLVDWKSNHLGYAPADYAQPRLEAAMAEHGYHVQHLLYALALDRYLARRVRGYRRHAHFGGALYLFVRGVRPDWTDEKGAPAGVLHHRPSARAFEALDRLFPARDDEGVR